MREKLRSSDKIQFLNNANEFTTTCIKKQVIWMNTTSPYIDYEKLYELKKLLELINLEKKNIVCEKLIDEIIIYTN